MVVRNPVDMVVEGVERRGGDDSRLAHRSAEVVLPTARPRHQLVRTGDQRAERATEALGEAERDRVESAPDSRGRDAARDRGVHEPGAVQVDPQVVLATDGEDRVDLLQRPDATTRAVVRVLAGDEAGRS